MARSAIFLSGMRLPPRSPSLAVITTLQRGVDDAVAQRLGAEAAEDHRVHRADARAGEHGVGQLGDHRHVDADPVALLHAVGEQHVGQPADLVLELAVGDVAVLARLVAGPDDGGLVAAVLQVAVHAVEAGVEPPAREPGEVDLLVVGVEDRVPGVEPGRGASACSPQNHSGLSSERR